jgi:hypothetical protein
MSIAADYLSRLQSLRRLRRQYSEALAKMPSDALRSDVSKAPESRAATTTAFHTCCPTCCPLGQACTD